MKSLKKKTSLASGGTMEQRIAYLFVAMERELKDLQFYVKRCAFRETNEFLFLVPSPKIILGRRLRLLLP